ncbi:MAG: YbbR-like domain-containing protein [Candidatus Pristimantibacillus sp.]
MDKWLSHPTALKVLSVVIAMLLWAVVHFDPESTPAKVTSSMDTKVYEAQSVIPIGLDESKYALVMLEPTVVRVMVEGRRANLLNAKDEDIVVQADLTDLKEGEHVVPLSYKFPKGLSLVEMSPQSVRVELLEIQTKPFDLEVITKGSPANGYITGTPLFAQEGNNQVQVTLPKDEMSLVGSVSTTISVEGAEKTVEEKKSRIIVYDTEGKPMEHATVSPATVSVSIPVTPPMKVVPLKFSYTGSLPDGLSVSSVKPEINKVAIYGDQALLDSLDSYDAATVDLSKLKQTGTVKAKVTAGGGLKMVEPSEINVEVTVVASETKTINRPITWNGLSDGLKATVIEPADSNVPVEVRGAPSALAALQSDQVQLTGNLEGLEVGTHTIKLKASLPQFIQLAAGAEVALQVKIEITDDSISTGTEPDDEDNSTGSQPTPPPVKPPEEETPGSEGGNNGGDSGNGSGNNSGAGNGIDGSEESPSTGANGT